MEEKTLNWAISFFFIILLLLATISIDVQMLLHAVSDLIAVGYSPGKFFTIVGLAAIAFAFRSSLSEKQQAGFYNYFWFVVCMALLLMIIHAVIILAVSRVPGFSSYFEHPALNKELELIEGTGSVFFRVDHSHILKPALVAPFLALGLPVNTDDFDMGIQSLSVVPLEIQLFAFLFLAGFVVEVLLFSAKSKLDAPSFLVFLIGAYLVAKSFVDGGPFSGEAVSGIAFLVISGYLGNARRFGKNFWDRLNNDFKLFLLSFIASLVVLFFSQTAYLHGVPPIGEGSHFQLVLFGIALRTMLVFGIYALLSAFGEDTQNVRLALLLLAIFAILISGVASLSMHSYFGTKLMTYYSTVNPGERLVIFYSEPINVPIPEGVSVTCTPVYRGSVCEFVPENATLRVSDVALSAGKTGWEGRFYKCESCDLNQTIELEIEIFPLETDSKLSTNLSIQGRITPLSIINEDGVYYSTFAVWKNPAYANNRRLWVYYFLSQNKGRFVTLFSD